MPAKYSVVQYFPDPINGERINIRVLVFGEGQVRSKFLTDWERVRRFADGDIDTAKAFSEWVQLETKHPYAAPASAPLRNISVPLHLDAIAIERMASEWSNAIQLTQPQPSLEEPEALLARLAKVFLREPQRREAAFRDREFVAHQAFHAVRDAVARRLDRSTARTVVKPNYVIGGKLVPNIPVDLAVQNGQIFLVSQAVSFETPDSGVVDRQVREAIYRLRDIRDLRSGIKLDVVALPPAPEHQSSQRILEAFEALPEMCQQIGARLVLDHNVPDWADDVASLVETHLGYERLKFA